MSMFQIPLQMRKKGGEEEGEEEEEEGRKRKSKRRRRKKKEEKEEVKAFAKIKKLNQYISTSPGSTTYRNTYNNWIDP